MNLRLCTTNAEGVLAERALAFCPDTDQVENEVVTLYPEIRFQALEGFGCAITDAAGSVYAQMDEGLRRRLMETCFDPRQMGCSTVRVPLDSCDFSVGMYEAMSDPADRELRSFSFARTKQYILPMLEDARRAAGRPLDLMLSPWSPPAFMKTNGSRIHGGKLKPEYADFWADYLCRYIREFQDRGFRVRRISLQNEAKAEQTWDSCTYTAREEKVFLRDHMGPALRRHGLEGIEVFIWDHNKERAYERVRDTVDASTRDLVTGVACHWYSGDHFEALDLVRQSWPDLKLILSESCIEFSKDAETAPVETAGKLAHEIIGDLNHGICAIYDWNLLLDETGGPNHVNNLCLAPFLYDRKKKALCPQLVQKYFCHFGHYIHPGARRIAFSKYTDRLDVTAFLNPDGTIAMVCLNRADKSLPVHLRLDGGVASFSLPPQTISTAVLR